MDHGHAHVLRLPDLGPSHWPTRVPTTLPQSALPCSSIASHHDLPFIPPRKLESRMCSLNRFHSRYALPFSDCWWSLRPNEVLVSDWKQNGRGERMGRLDMLDAWRGRCQRERTCAGERLFGDLAGSNVEKYARMWDYLMVAHEQLPPQAMHGDFQV